MIVTKLKLSRDEVQAYFYDGDTIFELALVTGSARLVYLAFPYF